MISDFDTQYTIINNQEFDDYARNRSFSDGPFIESFGDGYGEPYYPNRWIWGTLIDGRKVKAKCGN